MPTVLQQARDGRVMLWAGILGGEVACPFRDCEGVKISSARYVEFVTGHFLPWHKKNPAFQNKKFMQDNASPLPAKKNTIDSLVVIRINGEKYHDVATIIPWPQPCLEPGEHP